MPKQNQLVQLIHSLSKNEKREFVLYATVYTGQRNYLALYHLHLFHPNWTKEQILEELGYASIQNLYVGRAYLMRAILHLLFQRRISISQSQLGDYWKVAPNLIEKGMIPLARKILFAGLELCRKKERFTEAIEITVLLTPILRESPNEHQRILTTRLELQSQMVIWLHWESEGEKFRPFLLSGQSRFCLKDKETLSQIRKTAMRDSERVQKSLRALKSLYGLQMIVALKRAEWESVIDVGSKWQKLFAGFEFLQKDYSEEHLCMLTHLGWITAIQGNHNEGHFLLQKIEGIEYKSEKLKQTQTALSGILSLEMGILQEDQAFSAAGYQQLCSLLLSNHLLPDPLQNWGQFTLAKHAFTFQEIEEANNWLHKLLLRKGRPTINHQGWSETGDFWGYAAVLFAIVQLEGNNPELAKTFLIRARTVLQRSGGLGNYDRFLIETIGACVNIRGKSLYNYLRKKSMELDKIPDFPNLRIGMKWLDIRPWLGRALDKSNKQI